ncbi:MAG: hypothetical protein FWF49_05015 [Oscillospiraceae bacterium]|nr:hypothetical protein [Oscillospiraceae bacterium]
MTKGKKVRAFAAAFVLTLIVLGACGGMALAGSNTRRAAFAASSPAPSSTADSAEEWLQAGPLQTALAGLAALLPPTARLQWWAFVSLNGTAQAAAAAVTGTASP